MSGRPDPTLRIIHAAIVGGVLLFTGVAVALKPSDAGTTPGWVTWLWLAPAALAVFLAGFVRGRLPRGADAGKVRSSAITIWAVAEGAALCGLAMALVTGGWAAVLGPAIVSLGLLAYHGPSSFG